MNKPTMDQTNGRTLIGTALIIALSVPIVLLSFGCRDSKQQVGGGAGVLRKRTAPPEDRLFEIDQSLEKSGLREEDRTYLLETLKGGDPGKPHAAALILAKAAGMGEFSENDLLMILEDRTINAEAGQASLFALDYASVLKITGRVGQAWDDELSSLLQKHKSNLLLDQEERDYISGVLASNETHKGQLVCKIIVQKEHLSAIDRGWLTDHINSTVKNSSAVESRFWEYIKRVVARRN